MAIDRTQYNALVDDSGAGTDGSVWDKNKVKTVVLDPIDALLTDPAAWTPTIVSSGGGTPTYTVQVARYDRTNGFVRVSGQIVLATLGTLAAGTITIAGLPVAHVTVSNLSSAVTVSYYTAASAGVVSGLIDSASSSIRLLLATAGASPVNLTKADLATTSTFIFSASYPVA